MPQHGVLNDDTPADIEEALDAAALQEENAALRDRLMRALADAENSRRRAERSAEETRQFAVADFARELLAVADNLQRALATADSQPPETSADKALIEGVRATLRMLMGVFERFSIRKIEALGAPFDPALHEAMLEMDDFSREPGTVAEVMEEGYTINGRLLRPARVVVARRRRETNAAAGS